MNEKRFDYVQGNGGFFFVDKKKLVDYDESFGDYDNYLSYVTDNCLEWKEIVDLLNSLSEENKQLRHKLQKKQEEEQLYANEIVKLNKEVKDNQFLQLGNDY